MKILARLLALALLSPTLAWPHADRILSIRADGSIPELPADFKDTRIVLRLSDAPRPRLLAFKLVSGGRTTVVAPCLLQMVELASAKDIQVAGSWYHELSSLPPYVHIQFVSDPAPTAIGLRPGLKFLFSLRDARIIQVERVIIEDGGSSARDLPVSKGNDCPAVPPDGPGGSVRLISPATPAR